MILAIFLASFLDARPPSNLSTEPFVRYTKKWKKTMYQCRNSWFFVKSERIRLRVVVYLTLIHFTRAHFARSVQFLEGTFYFKTSIFLFLFSFANSLRITSTIVVSRCCNRRKHGAEFNSPVSMWKWSNNNNNKARTPTTLPLNNSQKREARNSWFFGTFLATKKLHFDVGVVIWFYDRI